MSAQPNESLVNIAFLSDVKIFKGLEKNLAALQSLHQMMIFRKYNIGEKLITEGKIGDEFYILLRGRVFVEKTLPDGTKYVVSAFDDSLTPSFGEGALVDSEKRSASVICDTECETLVLTKEKFIQFGEEFPAWCMPIYKNIALVLIQRLKKTSEDMMLLHRALMDEIRD